MTNRYSGALAALLLGAATVALPPSAGAQTAAKRPATAKRYTPPRTPDGQPDLQGVWDYATITPFERPEELAGKAVFSDEEAAQYEKKTAELQNRDRRDHANTTERGTDGRSDLDRAYNEFWWDKGSKVVGTKQTSLVVDPPDGKVPPLTADGRTRSRVNRAFNTTSAREEGGVGRGFDSWVDRPLGERCLLWRTAGPPMVPGPYNNNVQLFQTRDTVVIFNEMIHENRVVPLDGRPHLGSTMRQWMGDSRGHWEGDTLVVDTINFTDKTPFQGSSQNMHLTERFTRVAPDMLIYEFTVDDPASFTKKWTASVPMRSNPDPIYEYACHEGNYAMANGLGGARAQERETAAKKGSR